MRNLIVLALFRAYAKAFRGNAIFAIEEPEIFLHPHAQRSLATLFEELARAGNQVLLLDPQRHIRRHRTQRSRGARRNV